VKRILMKKVFLLLLAFAVMVSGCHAWYNDPGNDSCLTVYSDLQEYHVAAGVPMEATLKIVNACGAGFNANLGVFFQNKDLSKVSFHALEQSLVNQVLEEEQDFFCPGEIVIKNDSFVGKNDLLVACWVDGKKDFEIEASSVDEKTGVIKRTVKKEVKSYEPLALTPTINTLKYVEKQGFGEKKSVESVFIPVGESYLKAKFTIPAGSIHKHGEFVFTFQDPSNPERKSVLDPWWNEGEYTDDGHAVVLLHFNDGAGTTATDATGSYDFTVTNAAGWTGTAKWGSNAYNFADSYRAVNNTLWDANPSEEGTVEFWFRPNVTLENPIAHTNYLVSKLMITGSDELIMRINTNGTLTTSAQMNGTEYTQTTVQASWTAGTWYHVALIWDADAVGLYIDGVLIEQDAASESWTGGSQANFVIGDYSNEAGSYYANVIMDEFAISDVNRNETSWFTYSTADANFTAFGGFSYSGEFPIYNYPLDGNQVIDFNVFDSENRRIVVDINYSTVNTQGTGTPILQDFNLNSSVCDSLDWNVSPAACSWDWNFSGVPDGNYYFLIDLNNGKNSSFKASSKTVGISSDVNLLIPVPIDEETLVQIDTNKYSFNLVVNIDGNINTYSGFTHKTYLSIPIGTDEDVIIDIDLNSTDYYGRGYTVKYDSPKDADTLQPYLVKTSVAGGTGFQSVLFTRNAANLAIPGVRIESKKVLPGSGLTVLEKLITDAAGSATFSFVSNDSYYLDVYVDGVLVKQDLELRPVFTQYDIYLSSGLVTPIDANVVDLIVSFYPSVGYIDSNSTVDLNVDVNVVGVLSVDFNVLVYFDENTLFNQRYTSNGLKEITGISVVDSPVVPLSVEVIAITEAGVVMSKTKSYSVNLSDYQRAVIDSIENFADSMNFGRHSHHKEITTFVAVLITIFAVGAMGHAARIDFSGQSIVAMVILGFFVAIGWVMLEAWIATAIIAAGLIVFIRSG